MRKIRMLTAALMCVVFLMSAAIAETTFLQHAADWTIEKLPLYVKLSVGVTAQMPFDENRSAMLHQILEPVSMHLALDGERSSMSIHVGESEALKMDRNGHQLQLSTIPELGFDSSGDTMSLLLGTEPVNDGIFYGLSGEAETLLEDGIALLGNMAPAFDEYEDRRPVKTNIADMGVARSCTDYIVQKGDVDAMKEALLSICPEGWLKEILASLTFSGKQSLRVYRTEDEVPLRAEYNGTCGVGDDLRTVKLVWRLRRDDTAWRDELTLTSPAKTGTNKNNLEFTRLIQKNKKGVLELEGDFSYNVTASRQTTTLSGKFDLQNTATSDADVIAGSVTLQQKLPGEKDAAGITLTPDLTISGTEENPVVQGSFGLQTLVGKNVLNDVVFKIDVQRWEATPWVEAENVINLDYLSKDEKEILRSDVMNSAATAIIRPLILLLGENADWFFREMTPEQVQNVIDAATHEVTE